MNRFADEISKLSKPRLALLCVELQRELEARRQSKAEPIAVLGIGCRLPGGVQGPDDYWRLLENGVDAIGPIPPERWDVERFYDASRTASGKMYTRSGGFLDRIDEFDPEFFGISPREARHMDPQHRLLLEVAWEALEHAGQPADRLAGSRTGVFIGIGTYDYAMWQTSQLVHDSISAYTGTGNTFCFASGRLSYLLGLHGPSVALDAACATSLVTVHLACQSLRAGECTLALAGGVNLMVTPEPTIFLSQAQALAPDGRCKTFDASADGYGRSEGCGIVVLKRLSDAVAAGDPVLAVIRGSAVNHDGRSAGLTVPNGTAQQAVIRDALAQAGVGPDEISYVEAHGTGTVLGDPIEVRALGAVLGRDRRRDHPLWIGAVKTNIGHCEVAAGVASLSKVVLALQHRTIPPHLHYQESNPHIAFDEIPARVPLAPTPWPADSAPRLAGVNAFGLSGTNAHLVVEEFAPSIDPHDDASEAPGPHVLALSARDAWSLAALASSWERALAEDGALAGERLGDICYTAAARRSHHRHRWAAVVHSIDDARRKVAGFAARAAAAAAAPAPAVPARREHRVAFVFSGQGSQWWAMGRELMAREAVFRTAIEQCTRFFGELGDTAVAAALHSDESGSRLADTEVAQPALFAVQVALCRLLHSWGIAPDAVIGHSVGEIAAAHVAGVLSLRDAARLALCRGRVMQRATGQGRMAAVPLAAADAEALARQFEGQLSVAAINSPSSAVLSGEPAAVTSALAELEARGIWQRLLPVNYAFHSHQMRPLCGELVAALGDFTPSAPTLPIVSTVTGRDASDTAFDAQYWAQNVAEPVQFAAGIADLIASGHDVFVEIGPQPVLQKPIVECLAAAGREGTVIGSLRRGVDEPTAMLETLASLYSLGFSVDWSALYQGSPRVVSLPRYPWHRRRLWLDADPAKPGQAAARNARGTAAVAPDANQPVVLADVLSHVHELRWEEVERRPGAVPPDEGGWLIFADRGGVGASLARALRARGEPCDVVFAAAEGFEPSDDGRAIDPTSTSALRDLLAGRQAVQPAVRGIVYLWGLDATLDDGPSPRAMVGGLLSIVQASRLAGWRARQLWVVTRGSQPALPGAASIALAQAPLWGMARTIPLELPGLSTVAVDLDPDDEATSVDSLVDELAGWDGVDQVALRQGRRYVPRLHRASLPVDDASVAPDRFAADATYLITGGTGGIGLALAGWMVRHGARHLVLASRSAPSADVASAVERLQADGAVVRTLQSDIARRDEAERLLAEIDATLPPLRGIVHAAGVIEVGFMERQSWEQFAAVFPAKVQGAWNLHTLTETRPLDFFVLFSSTASVFGSLGQANYSAANAFLDGLTYYRRSRGLTASTVNWGPWRDVGMAARLGDQVRERWALQGVKMLSSAEGLAAFGAVLASGAAQALPIAIDWPAFVASYPQIERTTLFARMITEGAVRTDGGGADAHVEVRRQLAAANPEDAARLIEDFVRRQFTEALGFEPSYWLDPQLGFLEMGVDSLIATRVMLTLNDALRVSLPVSLMFEHPTIASLAAEVARVRLASLPRPAAASEPVPPPAPPAAVDHRIAPPPPAAAGPAIADANQDKATAPVDLEPPAGRALVDEAEADPAPLSAAQQRLWFVTRFETAEPVYNEAFAMRVTGELDVPMWVAAFGEIVRRHEILRTVFRNGEEGPVQVVLPRGDISVPVEDLLDIAAEAREAHLRQRMTEEARGPFDLSTGPLWRARLFRLRPTEHVLVLVLHHIVTDGWSYGVLARELATIYAAATVGRPSPLPELPMQYRDYARLHRYELEGERVRADLDYWRRELKGVPPLEWPGMAARPARPSFRGATEPFLVPSALVERLTRAAQGERVTLFMFLLAGFFAVLHRYTDQDDFAVGTPVAGRARKETQSLIGLFVNLLVLRARVHGTLTFRALLAEVRRTAIEAFDHRDLPFDHLLEKLALRRDLSRAPLFQVLFVLQNTPASRLPMGQLELELLTVDRGTSKFDITLMLEPLARGLHGTIEYSTDLFDRAQMTGLVRHYQSLLAGVVANLDCPVGELPLLTADERAHILTAWNATARDWPGDPASSLVSWLEAQAARTPDATAVWADETTWTYAELHAQANRIARRLQRLGVAAESRVAVWVPRSPELVAALVGVLKAGGAYVPLDPTYPAARLAFQVADAHASVVLTTTAYADEVPAGPYVVEVIDGPDAAWRVEEPTAPPTRVHPDQLAYVIYTSGSTGQPKGAMNAHRGIVNRLEWMQATYVLSAADRVLQKTTSSFDVSVWEIFWPLGTGATLVLARPGGQNDPVYLADLVARAGVTVMHFVPAMLEAFVASGGLDSCGRVRLIVSSGEALPGPLAARCTAAWGGRLDNLYGPTEAAVDVTWQPCTVEATASAVVPIGRPVANTQVYVLDRAGEPAPVGVVGELFLGGVQVGRGYLDRPALTAERFVPDAFGGAAGARLYRTGDLARLRHDGVVEYLGRADQQVKLNGNRIELGEIEAALRLQPEVRDAVVALREDEPGVRRLVAYVVPAGSGAGLTVDLLRDRLRARLPAYMVPGVVVWLDELPLTPNGKVNRRALPSPSGERPALTANYTPPRTPLEATVAGVWAEVLRVDRVGIHDNFFDLGGASLAALEIMARLGEAGLSMDPLDPTQIFELQTVAELAAALAPGEGAAVAQSASLQGTAD